MTALLTGNSYASIVGEYSTKRDLCLVPYQVTFASKTKVKFYREFDVEKYNDVIPYLEEEARFTISNLETSFLYHKGIIQKVTADINKSEQIIYFDVFLAIGSSHTSFIELLEYLSCGLIDS